MARCRDMDAAARVRRRRWVIAELYEAGRIEHAARQRLTWCCRASDCGRICERLIKGPGKMLVSCADVNTGEQIDLYAAIADPTFQCPAGLW